MGAMPLSWNEIRDRAIAFSRDWAYAESEDADAKSFWDAFFQVFGVPRRRFASFEVRVKQVDELLDRVPPEPLWIGPGAALFRDPLEVIIQDRPRGHHAAGNVDQQDDVDASLAFVGCRARGRPRDKQAGNERAPCRASRGAAITPGSRAVAERTAT